MARRRLRRDDVISGAIAFIDEHGLQTLTMRRLGASLGVEAMALYRHVAGRGELVAAVINELIDRLFDDNLMAEAPASWEDYLARVANAMRDLALEHPRIFPLLATHPPEAPWLRPPLRSIRWVDHFLSSFLAYGFPEDRAVDVYKSFTSFLLGDLMLEVSALGVDIAPETAQATDDDDSLAQYPTVTRLQNTLSEDHAQREFDDGLDDLIERIRTSSEFSSKDTDTTC